MYVGFEDWFSGAEAGDLRTPDGVRPPDARERQMCWTLGCGRGEFLDVMRDAGIRARGVDSIPPWWSERDSAASMSWRAMRSSYLLRVCRDEAVGAIIAVQLIEHLPYDDLLGCLEGRAQTARAGRNPRLSRPSIRTPRRRSSTSGLTRRIAIRFSRDRARTLCRLIGFAGRLHLVPARGPAILTAIVAKPTGLRGRGS